MNKLTVLALGLAGILTAQTKTQSDWIRTCAPNQIRAIQRTGKKLFIYPDAANNRVFAVARSSTKPI